MSDSSCLPQAYMNKPGAGEKTQGTGTSMFSKDGAVGKMFNGKPACVFSTVAASCRRHFSGIFIDWFLSQLTASLAVLLNRLADPSTRKVPLGRTSTQTARLGVWFKKIWLKRSHDQFCGYGNGIIVREPDQPLHWLLSKSIESSAVSSNKTTKNMRCRQNLENPNVRVEIPTFGFPVP